MKKLAFSILTITALEALFFISCATSQNKLKLDPESEDFLSHSRYIITKEESKIFSELPPQARSSFIEEFWKRRDPTPATLSNEYREAYFERIEDANRLFKGPRPGWLQDRGRLYVLFGPPNERLTNPMGGRPIDPFADAREMTTGQRVATGESQPKSGSTTICFPLSASPTVLRLSLSILMEQAIIDSRPILMRRFQEE